MKKGKKKKKKKRKSYSRDDNCKKAKKDFVPATSAYVSRSRNFILKSFFIIKECDLTGDATAAIYLNIIS